MKMIDLILVNDKITVFTLISKKNTKRHDIILKTQKILKSDSTRLRYFRASDTIFIIYGSMGISLLVL